MEKRLSEQLLMQIRNGDVESRLHITEIERLASIGIPPPVVVSALPSSPADKYRNRRRAFLCILRILLVKRLPSIWPEELFGYWRWICLRNSGRNAAAAGSRFAACRIDISGCAKGARRFSACGIGRRTVWFLNGASRLTVLVFGSCEIFHRRGGDYK